MNEPQQQTPDMAKLDDRLDVPINAEVKADAAFYARAKNFKSAAEWVRYLIARELYGGLNHIQTVLRAATNDDGK